MYHANTLGPAAIVGTLPFTGLGLGWIVLAAFALIGAGFALGRIAPRRQA
jgi:hypothetical protein